MYADPMATRIPMLASELNKRNIPYVTQVPFYRPGEYICIRGCETQWTLGDTHNITCQKCGIEGKTK
jgi:hypothetical protein